VLVSWCQHGPNYLPGFDRTVWYIFQRQFVFLVNMGHMRHTFHKEPNELHVYFVSIFGRFLTSGA
jgi:hypothetical protein